MPTGELASAVERLAAQIAEGKVWMDYKEAALFLGYDESTFKALTRTGEIPRHKFSKGGYRYYAPELTKLLLDS